MLKWKLKSNKIINNNINKQVAIYLCIKRQSIKVWKVKCISVLRAIVFLFDSTGLPSPVLNADPCNRAKYIGK